MYWALQAFTRDFMVLKIDHAGVEYLGKETLEQVDKHAGVEYLGNFYKLGTRWQVQFN